jgi:hypothetical protein
LFQDGFKWLQNGYSIVSVRFHLSIIIICDSSKRLSLNNYKDDN